MSQREEEKVSVPAQGGKPTDQPDRNAENQTDEPEVQALDEGDIAILKTYVRPPLFPFVMMVEIVLLTTVTFRDKDLIQRRSRRRKLISQGSSSLSTKSLVCSLLSSLTEPLSPSFGSSQFLLCISEFHCPFGSKTSDKTVATFEFAIASPPLVDCRFVEQV